MKDRESVQLPENNSKDRRVAFFIMTVLILIALLILSVSAIVRTYGPFFGRVVDAASGEPLAGAVVLVRFYTEHHFQFDEPVPHVAEAVETQTDSQGEFTVPATRVYSFRFLHLWRPHALMAVFKPGHGAYPGHPDATPVFTPLGAVPENKPVVIRLPLLQTREERWFNLNVAFLDMDVPPAKGERFKKLVDEEKSQLGWLPGGNSPISPDLY